VRPCTAVRPQSRLIGQTAAAANFRAAFGAAIIGMQRAGRAPPGGGKLAAVRLMADDTLVLQVQEDSPLLAPPPEDLYDDDQSGLNGESGHSEGEGGRGGGGGGAVAGEGSTSPRRKSLGSRWRAGMGGRALKFSASTGDIVSGMTRSDSITRQDGASASTSTSALASTRSGNSRGAEATHGAAATGGGGGIGGGSGIGGGGGGGGDGGGGGGGGGGMGGAGMGEITVSIPEAVGTDGVDVDGGSPATPPEEISSVDPVAAARARRVRLAHRWGPVIIISMFASSIPLPPLWLGVIHVTAIVKPHTTISSLWETTPRAFEQCLVHYAGGQEGDDTGSIHRSSPIVLPTCIVGTDP